MNHTITADDIKVGDQLVVDFNSYDRDHGTVEVTVLDREDILDGDGPCVWLELEAPDFTDELIVFDWVEFTVKM